MCAGHTKWEGRQNNHHPNARARPRVGIEPPLVLGQPDDEGGDHDAEVVGCVAENMQKDACHAQIAVVVVVSVALGVGMGVVVTMRGYGGVVLFSLDVFVIVMLHE